MGRSSCTESDEDPNYATPFAVCPSGSEVGSGLPARGGDDDPADYGVRDGGDPGALPDDDEVGGGALPDLAAV